MGQRGPKPIPANVHLLKGNPSKKRLSTLADGARVPIEIPACPPVLDAEAKREWKRISHELEKLGLIAKVDRGPLAVYCAAWSRWVKAEKKLKSLDDAGLIETTPNGYQQIGVWLQISNRAAEQIKSYMSEFGMTPSARVRVNVSPQFDLFGDDSDGEKTSPASKYFGAR